MTKRNKGKMNNDAVASPLEFTVAFGVIIITIALVFSSVGNMFVPYDVSNADMSAKAMLVTEKLVKDMGLTVDGKTTWEDDPGNVTDLGLAQEKIVYEANYYDNGSTEILVDNLPKPDLAASDLDYTPDTNLNHGDTITVSFTAKNVGSANSSGFLWNLFIDNNLKLSGKYSDTLTAGQSVPISGKQISIPNDENKVYVLKVEIFPIVEDEDSNLDNNYDTVDISLKDNTKPDLAVTSLDYSPKNGLDNGESIIASFTVENINSPTSDGFDWVVSLNGNEKDNGSYSNSVAGGGELSFSTSSFLIPKDGQSTHTLKVEISPYGVDADSNNNIKTKTVVSTGNDPVNPVDPVVETVKVIGKECNKATLVGNLSSTGSYSQVDVWFKWRENGGSWESTSKITMDNTGEFTYHLINLKESTDYEYQAWAQGVGSSVNVSGDILSFNTGSCGAELKVTTGQASYSKGAISATLNVHGTVSGAWGEYSEVQVWFTWTALNTNDEVVDSGTSDSKTFSGSGNTFSFDDFEINELIGKWAVRPTFKYAVHGRFVGNDTIVNGETKTYVATILPGFSKLKADPIIESTEDGDVYSLKLSGHVTDIGNNDTGNTTFHVWCQHPDGSSESHYLGTGESTMAFSITHQDVSTVWNSSSDPPCVLTAGLTYYYQLQGELYTKVDGERVYQGELTSIIHQFVPGAKGPHDPQMDTLDAVEGIIYYKFFGQVIDTGKLLDSLWVGVRYKEHTTVADQAHLTERVPSSELSDSSIHFAEKIFPTIVGGQKFVLEPKKNNFEQGKSYDYCIYGYFYRPLINGELYIGFGPTYTFTYGDDGGDGGDGGSSCFLAGTDIAMADGTVKAIEDIQVGDTVQSLDTKDRAWKTGTVSKVFHHTPSEMTDYYLVINNELKVTPNHPFYVDGQWINAGELKIGDNFDGVTITSIERVYERVPTYNFEVEPYHTYRLVWGDNSTSAVHNAVAPSDKSVKLPSVSTIQISSSDYGQTTATLKGNLDDTGGENCEVWFKYKKASSSTWDETDHLYNRPAGSFSKDIAGLEKSTTYDYQAVAKNSKGTSYGTTEQFTTKSASPDVATTKPSVSTKDPYVSGNWVNLKGKLTKTGGEQCKVWFKYGKSCFLAGTDIAMADGTVKAIEDIQVGDTVQSLDTKDRAWKTGTVSKVFHHTPSEMTDYYLVINNELKVTPNHPFYVDGQWINAGELKIGDNFDGVTITSIERVYERVPTYNFEVKPYHTYRIVWGDNSTSAVHNAATGGDKWSRSTSEVSKSSASSFNEWVNLGDGNYWYQAYAKNSKGTVYGSKNNFTIGSGNCFLADTLVEMGDGSLKKIQNVQVGDIVTAFDEKTKTWQDAKVENVLHFSPEEMTDDYYLVLNGEFKLTPNHYLYKYGTWVEARYLKIGDQLGYGDKGITINSIQQVYNKVPVYDLELDSYHSYKVVFSSSDFIIAHNATSSSSLFNNDDGSSTSSGTTATIDGTSSSGSVDTTTTTTTTTDTTATDTTATDTTAIDLDGTKLYNEAVTDTGTTDTGTTDTTTGDEQPVLIEKKFVSMDKTPIKGCKNFVVEMYQSTTSSGMSYHHVIIKSYDAVDLGITKKKKIDKLQNIDYDQAKQALGLDEPRFAIYDFNIVIRDENGGVTFYGKPINNAKDVVSVHSRNIVIYDDVQGKSITATLTVTIFR